MALLFHDSVSSCGAQQFPLGVALQLPSVSSCGALQLPLGVALQLPLHGCDAAGNCKIEIVKVQDIHSTYMSEPIFATKTAALG